MSKIESFKDSERDAHGWRVRLDRALARWGAFVCRRRWWVIGAATALTVALASQLPNMTADFSTEGYLHSDDPALALYDEFRDQFERDDAIVVMGLLLFILFRRVSAVVLPLLVVTTSILASFGVMALLHIPF